MRVEVRHHCSDFDSYRAARVKSLFNAEKGCDWEKVAELPIEGKEWQIGLIVGPSGSGKTSIGSKIFNEPIYDLYSGWDSNKPIIDCIAPDGDFNTVTGMLSAVGLGDVPAWLRPFNVLSNGEKFRAGLARLACERPEHAVVDEFTSVIDRQIAKVGAAAFSKTWRRGKGKIVLLSCHYDIIEWLQPDWVYDTAEARFYERDCLRQRPKLELQIYKVRGTVFPRLFKQHYYLDLPLPVAAEYFVGFIGNEPVCHLAVAPLFTAGAYRSTRLVVMPEWQGIGVGTKFLAAVCEYHLKGNGRCGKNYLYFSILHIPSYAELYGTQRNGYKQEPAFMVQIRREAQVRWQSPCREKENLLNVLPDTEVISGQYRHLNILGNMIIKILGNKDSQAYKIAEACVREKGYRVWNESTGVYDLAIAPLLTEKVSVEVLKEPLYGTLIFHPSPLPYGRGASSIKWAYKRQEPITAATWFWADNGLDTGDICEQEIIKIDYSARPRDFYERDILPAMERTLVRCLDNIQMGYIRKIPQVESYSSYDKRL